MSPDIDATSYAGLRREIRANHVLLLTFNRPEARNALNTELLAAIADELVAAATDPLIRVAVVTGGARTFAAGADIGELAAHDRDSILADRRPQLWAQIRDFPKPLIAAVNGMALGAGCELAMLADIIIASADAKFGQPEINLGIIPGAGGTQRLTRAVGKSLAMRMVLSGQPIDAQAALAAGLVAEIVTDGEAETSALALAELIASRPPLAVQAAKASILRSFELPLAAGLSEERRLFCQLFDTEDRLEGLRAFREKRAAKFEGK